MAAAPIPEPARAEAPRPDPYRPEPTRTAPDRAAPDRAAPDRAAAPIPEPVPGFVDVDDFAQSPSSFDHQPPFRQRRRPGRLWAVLAIGFAVVTLGAVGAVAEFGLPSWLPLPQASTTQPDLKLSFPASQMERRPLPNGNDFFSIAGTITNIGKERRQVPGLIIVLRDSRSRAVYSREVAPPKPSLAPGESQTVNTALVDAPKAAVVAEVQWKQH